MEQNKCICCECTDNTKNYSFTYGMYRSNAPAQSSIPLGQTIRYNYQEHVMGESSVCLCRSCISKRKNKSYIKSGASWIVVALTVALLYSFEEVEGGRNLIIMLIGAIAAIYANLGAEKLFSKIFADFGLYPPTFAEKKRA